VGEEDANIFADFEKRGGASVGGGMFVIRFSPFNK